MAEDCEGSPTSSQVKSGDANDNRHRLQKSLPKLATTFPWRPQFLKRNKTSDSVTKTKHAEPELIQQPVHRQRHDCRAAGAECVAGPSTLPNKPTRSESGRDSYTARNGYSPTSTKLSTSTGWSSRYGSAATSDRSSLAWTQVTTPDRPPYYDTFVPRPGVIPDTSSGEENAYPARPYSATYYPRTSDRTAAEAVRIHSEEIRLSRSLEHERGAPTQIKARSQPSSTSHRHSLSSAWRTALSSKPDKGKAKAREYNEHVDGKMTKKERSKCFSQPPQPPLQPIRQPNEEMTPVSMDPGYDGWAEMPLLQKKKLSARVNSNLSKYNWSAAVRRKQQPPILEPIGPAGEDRFGQRPCSTSQHEEGHRVNHIDLGVSSSRTVPAGLPAAVAEDKDESDNYPSPSASGYLFSGGDYSSDEHTHTLSQSQKIPRDSTQPRQYRNGSVDPEALNSKHGKAAGFEKMCYSKHKSKAKAKNGEKWCDEDNDAQQKLEMWRPISKAGVGDDEAQFVLCESPAKIGRGTETETDS